MNEDLVAKASAMIDRACAAMQPQPDHTVTVVPGGESGYRNVLGHIGHGFTADGQWACGLAPSQSRGDGVPDSGPFWQVANAHGR